MKFLYTKKYILIFLLFLFALSAVIAGNYFYQKNTAVSQLPSNQNSDSKQKDGGGKVIPPGKENLPITVSINKAAAENGKLKSSIQLENKGNLGYEKLSYSARLIGKEEKIKTEGIVEYFLEPLPIAQIDSPAFTAKPGDVKKFDFELIYPKGAPSGEYNLKVEALTPEGDVYGSTTQKVSLKQSGPYLNIPVFGACKIIYNDTTYDNIAPTIGPNETITAQCDVANSSNQTVSAKPILDVAERSVFRYGLTKPKTVDNIDKISLEPNQKRTIEFPLPPQTKPQLYEALLHFVGDDGLPLSNYGLMRYIVGGPSATIRTAQLSADSVAKGSAFTVNINATPSVDLFQDETKTEGTFLKQPKLETLVTSGQTTCAQKTLDLPAGTTSWKEVIIDFKTQTDCSNPLLTAKITEAGQNLAELRKQYVSSEKPADPAQSNSAKPLSWAIPALAIPVILIIFAVFILLKKKKSPVNPPLALLIILGSAAVFFASAALIDVVKADIVVPPNGGQITVTRGGTGPWWATYHGGSYISYNGSNNVHAYFGGQIGAPDKWWYMAYRIRVWVNGGLQREAVWNTQNLGVGYVSFDYNTDIGVSNPSSAEARLYAGMNNQAGNNLQADSGMSTTGDSRDNNCGSGQPCYGRLYWAPSTPGGFYFRPLSTACSTPNAYVDMSWDGSSGATGYRVFRNGAQIADIGNSTSWRDNGVASNTGYSYWIRAYNGAGTTDSNTQSISTGNCNPPPTAPSLGVSNNFCSNYLGAVTLSWSASSYASGYRVFRDNVQIADVGGANSYTDYNRPNNSVIGYYVQAYGTGGATNSNWVSITTQNCDPPPTSATLWISANSACSGQTPSISIDWTDTANTSYYQIFKAPPASGWVYQGNFNPSNWTDNNLVRNSYYQYFIRSVGPTGQWRDSNVAGAYSPNCPVQVTAGNPTVSCSGEAPYSSISWSASTNVSAFKVWRHNGSTIELAATLPGTQTSYNDLGPGNTGLNRKAWYNYQISAVSAVGNPESYSNWGTWNQTGWCDTSPPNISLNVSNLLADCYATPTGTTNPKWDSIQPIRASSSDAIPSAGPSTGSGVDFVEFWLTQSDAPGPTRNYTDTTGSTVGTAPYGDSGTFEYTIPSSDMAPGNEFTLSARAVDVAGNISPFTPVKTFAYVPTCVAAWLQTTAGDVHSNININTPGGPTQ